jgi:hypothetical protein
VPLTVRLPVQTGCRRAFVAIASLALSAILASLIAQGRVAVAQLRAAQERYLADEGPQQAVIDAVDAVDIKVSTLRALLRQDLIAAPATAVAQNRAFLRALDDATTQP